MRRLILALSTLFIALSPMLGLAQRRSADEQAEMDLDPARDDEEDDDYYDEEEEEGPGLRGAEEEIETVEEAEDEPSEPSEPPSGDPSRLSWTAPASVVTLHGYMRTRAEIMRNFHVGRDNDGDAPPAGAVDRRNYPFRYFYPLERGSSVEGGCRDVSTGAESGCYGRANAFRTANMRLRLQPTIAVSDDILVHMLVDVFDNMVLGSTPSSLSVGAPTMASGLVPGLTLDSFATTMNPALYGRNSFQDSIYVRRAWAEVHGRDIGQLWFGRMPNHWGLGMLFNDGAGIDGDYSSDVDRIMGIVQIAGFQLAAAWDFANQGAITYPGALNGVPFDATQRDDVKQFSLIAARRLELSEQRRRLADGRVVFNGGLYFQYRSQQLSADRLPTASDGPVRFYDPAAAPYVFTRRNANSYTVDGWAQLLWRDLRVEIETVLITGSIRNTLIESFENRRNRILQFGYALELEYRALDGKLGVYFLHGFATGDADITGLSIREDLVTQPSTNNRISTFSFHPNYRIDLILFRNILGSVSGSYYFRPGISYDLRRTSHGQLVGVRADAIYSRAVTEVQTYGGDPNLGLELNASLYYRSELGPDLLDGLYVIANYGLLFPLAGLGYLPGELGAGVSDSLAKAQSFRLILGVRF